MKAMSRLYDPIAEINTLRMNGYIVKAINQSHFVVNDKFLLDSKRMRISVSGEPSKFWGWKMHGLLEKIKSLESPQPAKMWNLIYYIGSRKVETIAYNSTRTICEFEKNKRKYSENYKSGTLKIESTQ